MFYRPTLQMIFVSNYVRIFYKLKCDLHIAANDCSFEDGTCDWFNGDDIFSVKRTNWTVYNCTLGTHAEFKGRPNDINFPSSTS